MNNNMLLYIAAFCAVFLPAVWFFLLRDDTATGRRKDEFLDKPPLLFALCSGPIRLLMFCGVGNLFRRMIPSKCRNLQKELAYGGLGLKPEHVFCAQIVCVVFLGGIAAGITSLIIKEDQELSVPIAGAIAAFVGFFLPGVVVGNKVQTRRNEILHAIPFSIDLISSAMRGGLDFTAAIRFYVKLNIPGPLTGEYAEMLREMELGVIRTAALQNMAERIQIKEFTAFASAVVMGTELGASLTDTMEIQSEEMRKLRFSIAECKAQRAPSLMLLPMALFILPAVFIIILTPVFLKMKEAGVPLF